MFLEGSFTWLPPSQVCYAASGSGSFSVASCGGSGHVLPPLGIGTSVTHPVGVGLALVLHPVGVGLALVLHPVGVGLALVLPASSISVSLSLSESASMLMFVPFITKLCSSSPPSSSNWGDPSGRGQEGLHMTEGCSSNNQLLYYV